MLASHAWHMEGNCYLTDYHTIITNNDKSNRKGILRKAESDAIHSNSKYFDCSRCNENPLKCPMNTVLASVNIPSEIHQEFSEIRE